MKLWTFNRLGWLIMVAALLGPELEVRTTAAPTTVGLALWLRADAGTVGSPVSQWSDQSGNARHATQATGASQPSLVAGALNGLPVLRFDGVNDFLTFTLPVNGLSGMTIFLVAANTQNQTPGPSQAERAALFWNETASWGSLYVIPFQASVATRFGTTQVGNQPLYNRPSSIGSAFSLTTSLKNGSTDTLFVNGAQVLSQAGKLATIAGCRDTGNVGRGYNDNTHYAGDIAEVLVYNRALSAAERQEAEEYLNTKWLSAPTTPSVTVAATDATAGEPGSGQGPGTFTFTRTGSTAAGLTANFTVSGGATSGDDYGSIGTSASFAAGSATAIATVNVLDDALVEGAEPVVVTLTAGAGYTVGSPATATVTIQDDDSGGFPLSGIALWLKADTGVSGAAVSQWNDQSGNNRHATQGTGASQPALVVGALSGLPVVRFDGVNDFLTFTLPVNGLSGMTIFMVAANTQNQTPGPSQAERAALFWNETASWGSVYLIPFQASVVTRFGTTQAGNQPLYNRPSSIGSAFSMTTSLKNGSTDTLFVNGTQVLNQGGKLATIAGCRDTGNVGRGYNDNTHYAGDIAEVLVYNRALTVSERQEVEQYLNNKWLSAPTTPSVTVAATDATAGEPGSGQGSGLFTFTRTGSTAAGLTVNFAVGGSATSGGDYGSIGTTVSFAAGSATATATVNVLDDGAVEGNEVVVVTLAGGAGYSVGSPNSATVTIQDDDGGLPMAGLSLWLKADTGVSGAAVSQWNDQSGNNRHATQGTGASQPALVAGAVNGQSIVRFDGVNDFLTFTLPVNGLSGMTMFLVAANTQNQTPGPSQGERAALFWNETAAWGSLYLTPFQASVVARFGTTQAGNQPLYNRPSSIGSAFSLTTSLKNGSTDTLYVNSSQVLSQSGKLTTIAGCRDTGNVGRGYNDNTHYAGDIAEVLVYNRALTQGELDSVSSYLSSKYNLPVPTGAPQIITQPANVSVQQPAAATFSVVASGAAPLSYQWRRGGVPISGATSSSYTLSPTSAATDNGAQFDVVVTNPQGTITSATATLTVSANSNPDWWNAQWHFRVPIQVNSAAFARVDKPANVIVNFTQLLAPFGGGTMNLNSLRVIEVSNTGQILNASVPFQFDQDPAYNASSNARGTLVFVLGGSTAANTTRYFHVYFDTGAGFSAASVTPQVTTTDNISHEGQSSVRIVTSTGTYYYHKQGGGFASMEDINGGDWIGYHPGGGSAGEYRGIPNMGAVAHPGYVNSTSTILSQGPVKATIYSQSTDNTWRYMWEFYRGYATMTLLQAGGSYWLLYEGTPGGSYQPASDYWVRSSGETMLDNQVFVGDIANPEWVYFGDGGSSRYLFFAHHEDDSASDQYWNMENNMTVFGFGREYPCCGRFLTAVPAHLTIGFGESTGSAVLTINSAFRDLTTTVGSAQMLSGAAGFAAAGRTTSPPIINTTLPGEGVQLTLRAPNDDDDAWQLTMTGQAGTTYLIERSEDLFHWTPAGTVTVSPQGTAALPLSPMGRTGFFRARVE